MLLSIVEQTLARWPSRDPSGLSRGRRRTGLTAALQTAGIDVTTADHESDARVTVLPATLAKGLEYDHVIVVEPADIVAAEPRACTACTWSSPAPSPA